MKKVISVIICIILLATPFSNLLFASADTANMTVSKATVNPEETFKVIIKYDADAPLNSVSGQLTYNKSVLEYCGGGASAVGSNIFLNSTLNGETSTTFEILFRGYTEGTSSFALDLAGDKNGTKATVTAETSVVIASDDTVGDASLSALSISHGTLSPAFSPETTEYSATVPSDTDTINIKAVPSDGKSSVEGAGTFDLKKGDNKFTLTVSAKGGAKKSYNIVISKTDKDSNVADDPLSVDIDGEKYHIENNLSSVAIPANYITSTVKYNKETVNCISDSLKNYSICLLKNDEDGKTEWFYLDEDGDFAELKYILSNNEMYVIEDSDNHSKALGNWVLSNYTLENKTQAVCYRNTADKMKDFYVFYCYYNGESEYFRYDSSNNIFQRAPDFSPIVATSSESDNNYDSLIEKYRHLPDTGKFVIVLGIGEFLLLAVLIFLLISRKIIIKRNFSNAGKNGFELSDEDSDEID